MKLSYNIVISTLLLIGVPLLFEIINHISICLDNFDAQVEWKTGTYITDGDTTKLISEYQIFQPSLRYARVTLTSNRIDHYDKDGMLLYYTRDGYNVECFTSSTFSADVPVWKANIKTQRDIRHNYFARLYLQMEELEDYYMYHILGCDPKFDHYECHALFYDHELKTQYDRPSKFIYLDTQCNLITEHGTLLKPTHLIKYF